MTALTLRPFAKADLSAAPDLWLRAWTAQMPELAGYLDRGAWEHALIVDHLVRHAVIAAERDGTLVGFVVVDLAAGFIDQLVVAPEAARTGVGRALAATARAAITGQATLRVLQHNGPAIAFWQAMGCVRTAETVSPGTGLPSWSYIWP